MFVLAQIISLAGMLINIVAVQFKTKKQILLTIVVSNVLFVIGYILLKAYVGALTCGVTAIELIINTLLDEKGKKTPKLLIILYIIIFIVIGITSYNRFVDILPIIASLIFVLTLIQNKEKYVRLLILGNLVSWMTYDIFVGAYSAAASDIFVISSTLIAIYRYDIKKEVKEDEKNKSIKS